ncbi:MAG: PKD domain-containing protein, partial [Bacteroidetes bacterium]|nr:PKD domain-containing protein [Bacteroidota bacterium]
MKKIIKLSFLFCILFTLIWSCEKDDDITDSNQLPVAAFSVSDSIVLFNETITFTDQSTDTDGTVNWWLWNFEDGTVSTEQNTTHAFEVPGTYNVRLTVRDNKGGENEIRRQIIVKETEENLPPSAAFNISDDLFQTGETIALTDASSDSDGALVSWLWDFGNGDTSNEQNPNYTYGNTGVYTITLTITDDSGDSDTYSESLTIWGTKWSFATGAEIKPSSPAIDDDGTIVFGSYDSKIYALNSDGSLKWEYLTGARINTSPAIGADGTVYCGSDDDSMYALNADGTLKWSFPTGGNIVYST